MRVDGKEVDIRSLPWDHFKDQGLPETKIELEVRKRKAMDEWLAKNGWLGLFMHLLKNGVFQIGDDQEDVLEGLVDDGHGHPIHAAIAAKVLETPWDKLARRMKLGSAPLILDFDAEQLALGFHWPPWYSVPWLHLHAIYPRRDMVRRYKYTPLSFYSPERVLRRIEDQMR